jgi:hypothetical protein
MIIFDMIEMGKEPGHIVYTTLGRETKKRRMLLLSFKISK